MSKKIIIPEIIFTKKGYNNLFKEKELLQKKRPNAVQTLARARALGDLSENSLYRAAKQELRSIDNKIARLEGLIKFGNVVEPKNTNTVQIGTKVTYMHQDKKKTVYIVGNYEADPEKSMLSYKSPIGEALMGKGVGRNVSVKTPMKTIKVKILSIE